jgi:hypothetical protein
MICTWLFIRDDQRRDPAAAIAAQQTKDGIVATKLYRWIRISGFA